MFGQIIASAVAAKSHLEDVIKLSGVPVRHGRGNGRTHHRADHRPDADQDKLGMEDRWEVKTSKNNIIAIKTLRTANEKHYRRF